MATGGFGTTMGGPSQALLEQKLRAEQIVRRGAGWFLTVGGLSILNSVLAMTGAGLYFIFGLGVTQIVDAMGAQSGATGSTLGLIVNLFIAGIFVGFWNFARNGERWAFLTGMALYAIDGLVLLYYRQILSVGFHAYALYRIYSGMQGIPVLEKIRQTLAPAGAPIEPR